MPGLFSANLAGQVRRNRSMGNAQARNAPLGAAPAYGNTTNPNGAVTASQMNAPVGLAPAAPTAPAPSSASAMPGSSGAAPYAGGDVAGLAAYYRNSATAKYNQYAPGGAVDKEVPFLRANPVAPASSQLAGMTAATMPVSTPNTANVVNQYANPVAGLSPDQKLQIARQSAARTMAGGPAADPTNLSGRMAGFNSNATPWYDRQRNAQREAENTARQAASQQLLSGIPADAAMDRTYKGPFGKQTPDGMAYTNRLGALEAMAAANPSDTNVEMALRYEQDVAAARSEKTAARLKAFKDANGGLSPRQLRRQKETGMAGIPSKAPSTKSEIDRTRLPNGQLPESTRERAATTARNLTDPNYKGPSPEFNQAAEVVRSMGLTADATPFDASRKISETAIPQDPASRKRYATALRQYWGSMRDSNAAWDGQKNKTGSHLNDPVIDMLNQLAETPENQVDQWLTTWERFIKSGESAQVSNY